jgi:two-component system, NtrC family, nitrogen regulation sensor histidine kinase NtrY
LDRIVQRDVWARFSRLRRQRRVQTALTLGLVFLGPVLAVATFLAMGPFNQDAASPVLRLILLADLIYVLAIAALVLVRVMRLVADRRSRSAGSRLHLRLSGVFMLIALIPTVLVAVFAVLSINIGLEGWFSQRVRSVVGSSLGAAEAYEAVQRDDLAEDVVALANFLNNAKRQSVFLGDDQVRPLLSQGQQIIQRGLKEAYLVDSTGALRTRGERSYLFGFDAPTPEQLQLARDGNTVLIPTGRTTNSAH